VSNTFENTFGEVDAEELSLIEIRNRAMAITRLADERINSSNPEDKRVDDLMGVALELMRQLQQHMFTSNARMRTINEGLSEVENLLYTFHDGDAEITALENRIAEADKRLNRIEEILEAAEAKQNFPPKKEL
jgi:DNA repair exonuclease SbcCD ATPase subunit